MRHVMPLIALAILMLTSCATGGPASSQSYCSIAKPIYIDKADKLTTPTLRAIVGHNEVGAKLCDWKAPGK